MGIVDDNGYEGVRGLDYGEYGVGNEHGMGRIWPCKGGSDEVSDVLMGMKTLERMGGG